MKLKRLLGALCAGLMLVSLPVKATEQASFVTPVTGPMNMATFAGTHLNPALRALAACNWGPTAPANGPGAAALPYQLWCDTTTNPVVVKMYDGASWVVTGKLNTSSHGWTPSYLGTDLGTASTATTGTGGHTLGFLDGANTVSGVWNLGTPSAAVLTNATGLPVLTGVSGFGTGVAAALGVNVGSSGAPVVNGGALGTPSSGTLTNATGLPIGTGISGLATGVATFLATPSSANLRSALTDEAGTGASYFVGGALGTPASGTLTNATGLPISTGVSGLGTGIATALGINVGTAGSPAVNGGALGTPSSGTLTNATGLPLSGLTAQSAFTFVGNNTSGSAIPTAVDIAALTAKASPVATDLVMISDQAASGAWKKVTISSLASAGSVASIAGNTGAFTLSGILTNSVNDLRVVAAVKADQTAASSTTVAVVPAVQQNHPSAAKAWAYVTYSGATPTLAAGYNVASVTAGATGNLTVTFTTPFASTAFPVFIDSTNTVANTGDDVVQTRNVGSIIIQHFEAGSATNPGSFNVLCFGLQ